MFNYFLYSSSNLYISRRLRPWLVTCTALQDTLRSRTRSMRKWAEFCPRLDLSHQRWSTACPILKLLLKKLSGKFLWTLAVSPLLFCHACFIGVQISIHSSINVHPSISPDIRVHYSQTIWAESSEFVSSSIPSWQILTAHTQPFRGARDLAFCLKVPLHSLLVWASSGGSGETARMRRLAWTFAARIGDKYQIRLTRSI